MKQIERFTPKDIRRYFSHVRRHRNGFRKYNKMKVWNETLYGKKNGSISRSIEIFTVMYLDTHI